MFTPTISNAQKNYLSGVYIGSYDSNYKMNFYVYNIDVTNNTFTGRVYLYSDYYDIDKNVSGTVTFYDDYYTCSFSFTYNFFISYDAVFNININPLVGTATGDGAGGILIDSDSILMYGSVNEFYNKAHSYDENDMKMCMALSNEMYSKKKDDKIIENLFDLISMYFSKTPSDEIIIKNHTEDEDPNNVAFAMLNRKNSDNSIDLIVAIRGTYNDEWQGNVQITGETYNDEENVHDNFNKAKDNIKDDIKKYYDDYCNNYNKVNLIITGHSRGAAVANLYAKDATDVMNTGVTTENMPLFDNVTAYTFACPNVEKVTENNTFQNMASYKNIYNFWFDSDIVPTVPLTDPKDGWNYWKYGKCYTKDISSICDWSASIEKNSFSVSISGPLNENINNEMKLAFSQWSTVDDYYNKELAVYDLSNMSINMDFTTLYEFLYNATYFKTTSNKIFGINAIRNMANTPELSPLLSFAVSNVGTISKSHNYDTYNNVINGNDKIAGCGSSNFELYTYCDAIGQYATQTNYAISPLSEDDESTITYDSVEKQKLISFANSNNNNEILGWNLEEPSTWNGIIWDANGNVSKIEFTYKWLKGDLDCSDFLALKSINTYANLLTGIDLSGDSQLLTLNCNYNNLSQSGLDLSDCTALTELYCDGCGLNTLNLSELTNLQILSCSLNNLIALDIENNLNLKHINCIYNYLDVHNGGTLYTQLNNYQSANNAYINYYQQLLPSNAVISTEELQELERFAKIENNNLELDWLDDNGDISLEKIQNNALFEYDGEKYRIAALDVSDLNIQGDLNLSSFSKLKNLYCENTKITSLNLSGATSLEMLECSNSE